MRMPSYILLVLPLTYFVSFSQSQNESPRCVDLSLNAMRFCDSASATAVLGPRIIIPWRLSGVGDSTSAPEGEVRFLNAAKTEMLTIFAASNYVYFRFIVSSPKGTPKGIQRLKGVKSFKSGKGIRLGMSQAELIEKLGKGYVETTEEGLTVYSYVVDDHPSIVEVYGYPEYSAHYKFRQDKLAEFSFGFSE